MLEFEQQLEGIPALFLFYRGDMIDSKYYSHFLLFYSSPFMKSFFHFCFLANVGFVGLDLKGFNRLVNKAIELGS